MKFCVLAHHSVDILVAVVLVVAAILKAYQLFVGRGPMLVGVFHYQQLVPFLIEAELLLGLWLLLGRRSWIRSICAVTCFSIFAIIAAYEAFHALPSCGCFGDVKVPPAITAGFDGVAAVGIWLTRPRRAARVPSGSSRARIAGGVALVGVASAIFWTCYFLEVPSAKGHPRATSGDVVILEPSDWLNKPFLLAAHIDVGSQLRQGRWIVLLVHHDCDTCAGTVPKYQSVVAGMKSPRLAVIEMPSYAGLGEALPWPATPGLAGRLDTTRDWFATTPVALLVQDGIVQAAADGEHAVTPDAAWFIKGYNFFGGGDVDRAMK